MEKQVSVKDLKKLYESGKTLSETLDEVPAELGLLFRSLIY